MYEVFGTNLASILSVYVVIVGACILIFPFTHLITEILRRFKR